MTRNLSLYIKSPKKIVRNTTRETWLVLNDAETKGEKCGRKTPSSSTGSSIKDLLTRNVNIKKTRSSHCSIHKSKKENVSRVVSECIVLEKKRPQTK